MIDFLRRAKRLRYADEGFAVRPSRPGSQDFQYQEGALLYIDSRIGQRMFGGTEGVWKNLRPFWCMNYYGRILHADFRPGFLREALLRMDPAAPFRGPLLYETGDLRYQCQYEGDLRRFHGEEQIYQGNVLLYECRFHGGLIDDESCHASAIQMEKDS